MDYPQHLLNLDLCILSYHLYHQSLVWPIDPWYEAIAHAGSDRRTNFMKEVRKDVGTLFKGPARIGEVEIARAADHASYAGTQELRFGIQHAASEQQGRLDPIVTNYMRLDPRMPALTRDNEKFMLIKTPTEITSTIGAMSVARKTAPGQVGTVVLPIRALGGANPLVAFEGGTGGLGTPGSVSTYQTAAWSLMGFVMGRRNAAGGWDAHIVFRGSRSGSAERAAMQGMDSSTAASAVRDNVTSLPSRAGNAVPTLFAPVGYVLGAASMPFVALGSLATPGQQAGNADWVTDMDNMVQVECPRISKIGKVGRGFANSVLTCLETILAACASLNMGGAPNNIYVSGHSLGAALATAFTSAVVLGSFADEIAQSAVSAWPWSRLNCICYALPVVGDTKWVKAFNLVHNAQMKYIWVTGDIVVTAGRGAFAKTGGIAGHQPGIELELPALNPKVADNPHEIYVIRSCLLRDALPAAAGPAHDGLKIEAAIANATPWGYYSTMGRLMAGTAFSHKPAAAAAHTLLAADGLRPLLRHYNFGEEWMRYIELYCRVIGQSSSYRGASLESTRTKRQAALKHAAVTLFRQTRLVNNMPPAISKDKLLTNLEHELQVLDDTIGGTTGMSKYEFRFLTLGFVLMVYERRADLTFADLTNPSRRHVKKSTESALGAKKK